VMDDKGGEEKKIKAYLSWWNRSDQFVLSTPKLLCI
jgi:hypothetical protein